jgi:hypothetical protein
MLQKIMVDETGKSEMQVETIDPKTVNKIDRQKQISEYLQ